MSKICYLLTFVVLMASCGEGSQNRRKKHFLHKGNVAAKEKLYAEAIRYYRSAIEIDANFAQAYNNLGIVYVKQEKYVEADQAFTRCLTKDPNFIDAYYNRGNTNIELENYRKAIADLRQIDGAYKPLQMVHFSKGLAYFGLKKYDSAASNFRSALQMDSTNIENYLNLAHLPVFI
jgi:tetratricopeptide (TPR) repeat protein